MTGFIMGHQNVYDFYRKFSRKFAEKVVRILHIHVNFL